MRYRLRTLMIVLALGPMVLVIGYGFWVKTFPYSGEPYVIETSVLQSLGPGQPETVTITYSNGSVVRKTRMPQYDPPPTHQVGPVNRKQPKDDD